jgi:predicted SAM-dependent methyltransferase
MKLNIGDAGKDFPGYTGIDASRGDKAEDLSRFEDSSVDEVRASHVFEHFGHRESAAVLKEWVRVLKPGGVLKIAVPDFKVIAEQFLLGAELPIEKYVMGAQVDAHDFHKSVFDAETLRGLMKQAGLIGIRRWMDEIEDCSRLPISLNLAGTKPHEKWPKCAAVISMPRLGFNDFWDCVTSYLKHFMPVRRITGAYWDANLSQCIEEAIAEFDPEWILTCDYDTVFDNEHILALLDLAVRHPEADAIAPIQTARWHDRPMMTVKGPDGQPKKEATREDFTIPELMEADTAHFGLTLLRRSKLDAMDKPWMQRRYGADACDPDIDFWRHWKASGNTLFTALRVPVGHCELMVRWPDVNLETIHQKPADFFKSGPPERVWQ